MGCTLQFESHKVELWAIYTMEYDPTVLEYYDQPTTLTLRYPSPTGRQVTVQHTPDFLVLRPDGAVFEEWKPEERLQELAITQPHRYQRQAPDRWACPPGEQATARLGLRYQVRSSAALSPTTIRNLIFLEDYVGVSLVPPSIHAALRERVEASPGISLATLLHESALATADQVYALLAQNVLYVDLAAGPLVEAQQVRVYRDQPTAAAQALLRAARLRTPSGPEGTAIASEFLLTPGTRVWWDGQLWHLVNLGHTTVTLRTDDGTPLDLTRAYFLQQIDLGLITLPRPPTTDERAYVHPEAQQRLRAASPADLATANHRWALVSACLEQRRVDGVAPSPSPRTLRTWVARWRAAEATYHCGYIGLLPQTAQRGNRTPRTPQEAYDFLDTFIAEHFETPTQPPARTIYRTYHLACQERGLPGLSERTFYRRLTQRRGTLQTTKRYGARAAYAATPWYWALTPTTPPHGDRPWEIVHLDHTQLDLELVSQMGTRLGRPWVTFAMDAYSRRILGVYLSFDPPAYRACMMVLRACVRRHQRFPQSIVVDGGPEFHSVYFESLLARYYCTKKTRPTAHPRFGSVIERLFGTTNTAFIHTLRGNTQAAVVPRTLTPAVDPKRLAVWPLPGLYHCLCTWAYTIYDGQVHAALGHSPQDAYQLGLERYGLRAHRRVLYDEAFLMATHPSPRRPTARVVPGKGVKIHYLYYWHDALRHPEVERTQVPVRYDPFDIGTAYAYCRGQWMRCLSQYYHVLHGHSAKELALATTVLRQQARRHHQTAAITALRLAEFLADVQAHEQVLLQRLRDLESRAVLEALDAGNLERTTDTPGLALPAPTFPPVDLATIPAFEEYHL
jgi:putative transposase